MIVIVKPLLQAYFRTQRILHYQYIPHQYHYRPPESPLKTRFSSTRLLISITPLARVELFLYRHMISLHRWTITFEPTGLWDKHSFMTGLTFGTYFNGAAASDG